MPEWMNIPDMADEQPEKRIHLSRYEYARDALKGKRVLDCACGMGYGTDIMAAKCYVTGVDIDPEAIQLANARFDRRYFVDDIHGVTMQDYDALVSFETLEHLDDPHAVIAGLASNIKEIVASVPIRPTVGWNPWHRSDFTKDSFRAMIGSQFDIVNEFGQMWIDGEDLYLVVHGRRS